MKNNKSKKIFIISIVSIIVLLLIVGVAFALFSSNAFKSNKDLFFEYAAQMFNKENGFIDNKLVQYNEKKNNSIYEHEGKFTANVESDLLKESELENIENFNISFAGNVDNYNEKCEELIKINYSDKSSFPIMYKRIEDINAIKMNDISKRYFGVNEKKLGNLLNKLTNTEDTTNTSSNKEIGNVDLSYLEFSNEDLQSLQDNYLKIIQENLDESDFTKVSTNDGEGYSLRIDNNKFKELIIKIFEVLKNDELMLDKLSNITGTNITSSSIENSIEQIEEKEIADGNSIITVYQSKNKLNKIQIQFNDEFKLTISKTSDEDNVNYIIDFESQTYSINYTINYSGLKDLNTIKEKYSLVLNLGTTGEVYAYNIENSVNFTSDNITINDFEDGELLDLSGLNAETLAKVINSISKAIEKSNNEKIDKAGIKGNNPLLLIIPKLDNIETESIEKKEETQTTTEDKENQNEGSNENNQNSSSSSIVDSMENASKETFNERFSQYEGDNVKGNAVKSLLLQVIANNMLDEEDGGRPIQLTGDVVLTGNEVPDNVVASKTYKVKCSTDSDGYINKIDIKEK